MKEKKKGENSEPQYKLNADCVYMVFYVTNEKKEGKMKNGEK